MVYSDCGFRWVVLPCFDSCLTPASPILGKNMIETTRASKYLKPYMIQEHGPLNTLKPYTTLHDTKKPGPLNTSNPTRYKARASKNLKSKQKPGPLDTSNFTDTRTRASKNLKSQQVAFS